MPPMASRSAPVHAGLLPYASVQSTRFPAWPKMELKISRPNQDRAILETAQNYKNIAVKSSELTRRVCKDELRCEQMQPVDRTMRC